MNGLIEKFGPQRVLLVGTALVVAGFLLSSFSDSIWQLFLTYSVPVGVGCSFVWTTSLSLLPHYFERWLTVASSVAMTGRFLGMAIITPISRILMKSYGWRRMLQFFTLIGVPMCACAALFRPSAGSRRRKIDAMRRVGNCCKLQRNVRLTFYCWIGALQCTAITIPMTYIVEYAEETVEVDEEQSGFLLTAMAVTAAFSSIATGLIGLRIKRKMFLVQLLIAVGGLSSLLFPFYQSYQHLIVYMIIQGVCFGYVSLVYLVPLTSQMIDVNDACDAFGLQSFAMAFGSLGTAIGGGLHDLVGSYTPGFLLSGSISVVVSVILFLDEYLKKKCGRKGKYSIEKTTGTAEADAAAVATKDDIRTAIYYETYV
ncbi:monocarboxylate transporter 13-like isoform X2 [Corticium candelabrum]|nr:monocarboxylate transporter 13-like isoform X2 [Corticium candelabrum]